MERRPGDPKDDLAELTQDLPPHFMVLQINGMRDAMVIFTEGRKVVWIVGGGWVLVSG